MSDFSKIKIEADKEQVKRFYNDIEIRERIIRKQIADYNEKIETWVKEVVANAVTPPIKGEVTIGKLKWRGVALGVCCGEYVAAVQRGKEVARLIIKQ